MMVLLTFISSPNTAMENCLRIESSKRAISCGPSYDGENSPSIARDTSWFACTRFQMSAATYVPVDM